MNTFVVMASEMSPLAMVCLTILSIAFMVFLYFMSR